MKIFNKVDHARIVSSMSESGNALIMQNAFQVEKAYFLKQ